MSKPKVLILCTGNSMRSQMAEGLLRHDLGHLIDVFSAGTHPSYVHPNSIQTLAEIGIDISKHRSKSVREFIDQDIDLVITVCDSARENCPVLPGARSTWHQPYPDPFHMRPGDDPVEIFAALCDQMRAELVVIVRDQLGLVD